MSEGLASFTLGKNPPKYCMLSTPRHVAFDHHIISLLWYVHITFRNLHQATKYNKLLAYTFQNFSCLKNKMMALYYSTQLDKAGQRCIYQWQQRYLSTDEKLAEDMSAFYLLLDCIINLWHYPNLKVIALCKILSNKQHLLSSFLTFLKHNLMHYHKWMKEPQNLIKMRRKNGSVSDDL